MESKLQFLPWRGAESSGDLNKRGEAGGNVRKSGWLPGEASASREVPRTDSFWNYLGALEDAGLSAGPKKSTFLSFYFERIWGIGELQGPREILNKMGLAGPLNAAKKPWALRPPALCPRSILPGPGLSPPCEEPPPTLHALNQLLSCTD